MEATRREILTVGHSTRGPGELEELLRIHDVQLLVDVRAHPGSRRMPHFAREALERSLAQAGIEYLHAPGLGGRRRPRTDSPNGGWKNDQFQGYADHMESEDFRSAIVRVESIALAKRTTVMCAEAQWTRCHRRLVADALLVRGWGVLHIDSGGRTRVHELTEFAVRRPGERLEYPPQQDSFDV